MSSAAKQLPSLQRQRTGLHVSMPVFLASSEKHEEARAEKEQLRVTREEYATKLAQGRAVAKAASQETAKRRRAQEQRRKQKEQAEEERRREILAQRKTQHQQQVSQYRRRSDADPKDTSSRSAATTTRLKPKAVSLKTSSSSKHGKDDGPKRGLNPREQTFEAQESSASEWPFRVRPVPAFPRPGNRYTENSAAHPTQAPEPTDIEAALRAIGATTHSESHTAAQMTHSAERRRVAEMTHANGSRTAAQIPRDSEAESNDSSELAGASGRQASVQDTSGSDGDAFSEQQHLVQQASVESGATDETDETAGEEHDPLDGEESQETAEESCSELEAEPGTPPPSPYQPLSPKKHPDTQHLFEQPATISLETSETARRTVRFAQRPGSSTAWESSDAQAQRQDAAAAGNEEPLSPEVGRTGAAAAAATPDLGQFSDSLEMISVSSDGSDDEQAKPSGGAANTEMTSPPLNGRAADQAAKAGHARLPRSTSLQPDAAVQGLAFPSDAQRSAADNPKSSKDTTTKDASTAAPIGVFNNARSVTNGAQTRHDSGRPLPPQFLKAAGRSSSLSSIQKPAPPPPDLERRRSYQNMLARSEAPEDPVPRGILKRTEHKTIQRIVEAMESELRMSQPQPAGGRAQAANAARRRISFLEHDIILNEGERRAPPPVHCVEPPPQQRQQQRVQPPPFSAGNAFFLAAQRQKAQRQQMSRSLDLSPLPDEPDRGQQRGHRVGLQPASTPAGRPRYASPAAPRRAAVPEQQQPSHAADSNDMVWNQVRRCLSTARHDRHASPGDTSRTAMPGAAQAAAAAAPGSARLRRQSHPSPANGTNSSSSSGNARNPDQFQRGVVGRTFYHTGGDGGGSAAGADADSAFQRGGRDARPQPTAPLAVSAPLSSTASRRSGGYRSRGMATATNGASYSRMLEHYTAGEASSSTSSSSSSSSSRTVGDQRGAENACSDSGSSIASGAGHQGSGQRKASKAVAVNTELIRREQDMIQSLQRVEALLQGKVNVAETNEVQSYLASQARRPPRTGTRVFLKPPAAPTLAAGPPEESSALQSAAINAYIQQQHQDAARKRSKGRAGSCGHAASHGNVRAASQRRGSTGGSATSFHGAHL